MQALHVFIPVSFGQNTGRRDGSINAIPFDHTEMRNLFISMKEIVRLSAGIPAGVFNLLSARCMALKEASEY